MVEYSAGIVTAYGSAVRAGYTGTYEDFCRQQAQYADNASAVEQAKQTAVSASQSAVSASTTAQTASTTAVSASNTASTQAQLAGQSAQDAQTAESNAQTYAQSASASAGSAQQSAQTAQAVLESIPEDYSDLAEDVDKLKADLVDLGRNKISLYNSANNIDGKYWNSEGTLVDSSSWTITEKIAIVSDKGMYYTGITSTGSNPKAIFFDENEEFLSSFTPTIGTGTNILTIPNNAVYVSFSLPILTANNFSLWTTFIEIPDVSKTSRIAFLQNGLSIDARTRTITIPAQRCFCGGIVLNLQSTSIVYTQTALYNELYIDCTTGNLKITHANSGVSDNDFLLVAWMTTDTFFQKAVTISNINVNGYDSKQFDEQIAAKAFDDSIYSWWVYPLAVRYLGIRDKTYFGYTDSAGFQGVISIDNKTWHIDRKALRLGHIDDHNAASVSVLDDGRILCVLADHNFTNVNHVYISKNPESILEFEEEKRLALPTGYSGTSYAQVFKCGGKWWMFWRNLKVENGTTTFYWGLRTSNDGVTWGDATIFLTGGEAQYYLLARPYDDTKIKLYMTSNPSLSETDIRLGFIDTTTNEILNADMSTVLGDIDSISTPILYDSFTIVVNKGAYHQRLFDVGIGSDLSVLFCRLHGGTYTTYYARYDDGEWTEYPMPSQGEAFGPNYQNGATFIEEDKIVGCIYKDSAWHAVLYEFTTPSQDPSVAFTAEILATSPNDNIKIMRPVKCLNDNSVVVNRGKYSDISYTDFDTNIDRVYLD